MVEKVVNITVNQKGTEKAIAQTTQLNSKLNQLKATTGQVTQGLQSSSNAVLENGGAMGLLNDATGGYAMSVKDAVEATALFTKGSVIATAAQKVYTLVVGSTTGALKALRIALVSTGLGAIVVLLGLFISKMMDATDATEKEKSAIDALNSTLERQNQLYKDSISSLQDVNKERLLRAKIAGKSEQEIAKIEAETEKERYNNYINERKRLEALLRDRNLSAEQVTKINEQLTANQKEYFKSVNDGRVKDLEEELSVADAKRQAQKDLLLKQAEDRRKDYEEQLKLRLEFEKSLAQGLIDLQIATNEAEFEQDRVELENAQRQSDEIKKISDKAYKEEEEARAKSLLFAEITEKSKLDLATNTQNLLLNLFKKGSAIAKGIAIANVIRQQVESVSKIISSTAEANAKAVALSPLTAGQPFVTLNTVSAGIGIAASVAGALKAVKDITSESKSASGASVSGGGASAPSAPSFNIVAGTGSNQIASGLASNKTPIRAFVVSSEQRTADALDRNIVSEASFG